MKRIAIHSVPRSGSTWLGSIIDAHPVLFININLFFLMHSRVGYLMFQKRRYT